MRNKLGDIESTPARETGERILKTLVEYFGLSKKANIKSSLKLVEYAEFDNDTLKVTFRSVFNQQAFEKNCRAYVEYAANALLERNIKIESKSIEAPADRKNDFAATVARSKPKTRRRLLQTNDLFNGEFDFQN